MLRKPGAALFLVLWFILLGVEFSEDMGLIDYDEPAIDESVVAVLTGLGEAIKISDDLQLAISCFVSAYPAVYCQFPETEMVLIRLIEKRAQLVKADKPIYSLHQAFLI